jgi:ParB/RepB/Spo0J family partition protein
MTSFTDCEMKDVRIDQIDLKNDYYKISKPRIDDKLTQSIHTTGILSPPVILSSSNSENDAVFQIIFGHNRISVLKELNYASVPAIILQELKSEEYISQALLKNYRQEISSIGKMKFICILRDLFHLSQKNIISTIKSMQIPEDILSTDLPDIILSFPGPLKEYLDVRDIGLKVIKNILCLPDEVILLISGWTSMIGIRINLFKSIIDHIVDISKRDKSLSVLQCIDISLLPDKIRQDESLYKEIYKIRYPDYMQIKSRSDEIIHSLNQDGIGIVFPEYFEKDEISVVLKVNKKDGTDLLKKKIDRIDFGAIKNLLDLV